MNTWPDGIAAVQLVMAPLIHPTAEEEKNAQTIPWEKLAKIEKELSERWNRELAGK